MDKLFGDMAHEVIHYADDILIATNGTVAHHLKIVEKVLHRLIKGNIKIRPTKVNLCRENIFGNCVDQGKDLNPRWKVISFQKATFIKYTKKAKLVICCLAYYQKFIHKFAELARPIMELGAVHPKCFKWSESHENSFRKLIKLICDNAVLYLPDPKLPYYVQTDASQYAGTGRVFQKDEDGNEKVIACISRTFSKSEQSYQNNKKGSVSSAIYYKDSLHK
jgi:hypothetical protein